MTSAYFDCFAGAGGDMIVGALLDAGADFESLQGKLVGLGLQGYHLRAEAASRCGIAATRFVVETDEIEQPHRHLSDILETIDGASLPKRAAARAAEAFTRLGRAEAQVHGIPVEKVHFHEVGAVDSILDIVGACVALELLDVEEVSCGPIPLGCGTIRCDHGVMPVPAPATVELVRGFPTVAGPTDGELTTPTAAALLTTLSSQVGPAPEMRTDAIGYGAGTRDHPEVPNVLRVLLGRRAADGDLDAVMLLSANVDDCSGELIGTALDRLMEAGCLDAWATPAVMKKSRPGWVVSVLCTVSDVQEAESILFAEITTFGVRRSAWGRSKLDRSFRTVETRYGPIRVKQGRRDGQVRTASPEFEDCRAAAEAHHASVRDVMRAAQRAYEDEAES